MYTSLFQELTCGGRSEFWATIQVHSSGMPNVCESAAETVDKALDPSCAHFMMGQLE